ncbi:GreA/GreB family elongation factor [Alkalimarinus coralli]|uniref:GreA/GreB family elongation factor n=1 Tax=Alkalimarinus coralli TaxID=2935863 RepID=UPI00202AEF7C|nr:GreA/GreB family elongation factor [Alkalimarinus coralli]
MIKHSNRVYISQQDYNTISSLISSSKDFDNLSIELLDEELRNAELFENPAAMPKNVVMVYSIVNYTSLVSGEHHVVQIVPPQEVNIDLKRVSILSPVGSALIGLREGNQIQWPMPSGQVETLRIDIVEQRSK